jgi:hypothetical protein
LTAIVVFRFAKELPFRGAKGDNFAKNRAARPNTHCRVALLSFNAPSRRDRTMSAESKLHLMVNIPIAGDGFPNEDELNARNKIIDELDRRKFGHFVGAGGGMGAMDFSYVVTDEQAARQMVSEVIGRILPRKEFSIEVEPGDDIDIDEDGDEGEGEYNWPRIAGCLVVLAAIVGLAAWLIWWLMS